MLSAIIKTARQGIRSWQRKHIRHWSLILSAVQFTQAWHAHCTIDKILAKMLSTVAKCIVTGRSHSISRWHLQLHHTLPLTLSFLSIPCHLDEILTTLDPHFYRFSRYTKHRLSSSSPFRCTELAVTRPHCVNLDKPVHWVLATAGPTSDGVW